MIKNFLDQIYREAFGICDIENLAELRTAGSAAPRSVLMQNGGNVIV